MRRGRRQKRQRHYDQVRRPLLIGSSRVRAGRLTTTLPLFRLASDPCATTEARLFHSLSLLRPYLSSTHYTLLLASYLPSSSSTTLTTPSTPSTLTPAPTSSTTAELNPFPLYAAHLKSLVPVLSANPTPLTGAGSGSGSGGGGAKPGVKRKVSQGMAKLAKADTSGMKRMDSFFKKRVVEKEGEKVAVKGTEK